MRFSVVLSVLTASATALPLSAQTRAPVTDAPPWAVRAAGFGVGVAVDGDDLVVGRPGSFTFGLPAPATASGGVHVFSRSTDGSWEESQRVEAETRIGDAFGHSVAVAGTLLAVGAPGSDGGAGRAYVFERTGPGAGWTLAGTLTLPDANPGDSLGAAVAVAGTAVAVGAPHKGQTGAAYLFQRAGDGRWVPTELAAESYTRGARYGAALAASESVVAVGAPGGFPSMVPGGAPATLVPGAVQVFESTADGSWTPAAFLTPEEGGASALGWALTVSGPNLLAGAPLAGQFTGQVVRYHRGEDGAWSVAGSLTPAQPVPQGGFGMGVALADGAAIVGAPLSGSGAGGVYVFSTDTWAETQALQSAGGISFYGAPVAGAGDLALAAAPAEAFAGSVHVLTRSPDGTWTADHILDDPTGGLEPVVDAPAECAGEGTVHGFDCSDVDMVSFLPVRALGGGRGVIVNDVWGWTDPETGREYAIVGRNDATAFVDVTDAANPRYLGHLPLTQGATPNLWRDIKVYANHAFIVADGAGPHGVQIFDLTGLRDVSGEPVTFAETAHYDGIHSAHNIVINEGSGIAYAVGASMGGETCGGGLHMIDVRDPTAPTFLGCFSDAETGLAGTGYSHDAQCVVYAGPDPDHQGKEICFGANENSLSISDVSDKTNPVAVSRAQYPNSAYLHQGWISDDHRHFFMNDEGDEVAGLTPRTRTLVWDIEDLDDPILLGEHLGTTAASDHNLYVHGRFMYQSNYVSGLRILDVSDPSAIREVGYFDTMGGENAPGFAGSWSNYPFFESGNILVTSINEGLFILKKRQRPVS